MTKLDEMAEAYCGERKIAETFDPDYQEDWQDCPYREIAEWGYKAGALAVLEMIKEVGLKEWTHESVFKLHAMVKKELGLE